MHRFASALKFFAPAAVVLQLLVLDAAPAGAQALTVELVPTSIPNGGAVTISGTAPCGTVSIDGTPGALGVSVVRDTAEVIDGRFSKTIKLERFTPDPSRPGLYDNLHITVSCPDATHATAGATLHISGVELARTGTNSAPLALVGVLAILVGGFLARRARPHPRMRAQLPIRAPRVSVRAGFDCARR